MLTIKEIKYKDNRTECNSCGKVRKRYFEIRYGIPIRNFPWEPYQTLPLCASCIRKLGNSIEKKLTKVEKDGR